MCALSLSLSLSLSLAHTWFLLTRQITWLTDSRARLNNAWDFSFNLSVALQKIYQFFSDVICDSDSPWQFSIRPMSPFSFAHSSTAVPTRNTCYSFSFFPLSLSRPLFFLLTVVFRAVFIFKDTISQEPPLTHFTLQSCCNRISANIVLCLTLKPHTGWTNSDMLCATG